MEARPLWMVSMKGRAHRNERAVQRVVDPCFHHANSLRNGTTQAPMAGVLLPMPRSDQELFLRSSDREAHQPMLPTSPRTHRQQSDPSTQFVLGGNGLIRGRIQDKAGAHFRFLGLHQDTLRCWRWPTPRRPIP